MAIVAIEIANSYELNQNDYKIIIISSLLHDSYDHKYVKKPDRIKYRINQDLKRLNCTKQEIKLIHNIIEDISFSKEKKKRDLKTPKKQINTFTNKHYQLLRDIVSDADKYEAIGDSAIIRMIQYMNNHNDKSELKKYTSKWYDNHIKHIKEHSEEKLFILITNNYIRTKYGRKIAKKKEYNLRKLINNDQLIKELIKEHS